MNAVLSFVFSAWTVVVAVVFLLVVRWAFSARRAQEFAAAAQLPLEADDDGRIPALAPCGLKERK